MLKKLPYLFSCFFAAFAVTTVTAQEYQTMPVSSGFNADVIANGIGPANTSTSIAVDADDYVFMANNFQQTSTSTLPTIGLPASGFFNSAVAATTGLSFQLGPLSGNNALRLADALPSGTVTFATPIPLTTLYMVGTTGNGPATVSVLVTFSDGTNQPFTGTTVPDWFNSTTQPVALSGFGRLGRTTNTLEQPSGNPRLYQIALAISTTNQPKNVASVQVTKTSTGGVVSIFAFSGNAYTSCPAPTNIVAVPTTDGATVTWTAPSTAPSSGYEYVLTTTSTAPASTATPYGTTAAGVTNATLTGLIPGLTYYFWIRANCGSVKGFWKQTTFNAGEVAYTYSLGDSNTKYVNNDLTPITIATTTECPTPLSITVPAGYKIKSVGVTYTMTAQAGAWMSEQRSLLACITTNTTETAVTAGPATNSAGTATYNRSGINMAVGLTGTVAFEMRAWRIWQGNTPDCSTTYNKIDNNWKLRVTYEPLACATPATPSSVAQSMCPSAVYGDLQVNGIPGAVYKWYNQPTGGTAFTNIAQVTAGTYYVSQTVGTCESARSAGVAITTAGTGAPTAAPQTYCGGTTVAALQTTSGTNIKWYAAVEGGVALSPSTPLATGNYFVSQTLNNCESTRTTVAILINTTPVPTVSAQTFCAGTGTTTANLVATPIAGATINWYASQTITTTMAPTAPLGTGTYYVSQTSGGCESVRVAVQVTIATVVAPTAFAQEVCTGATVANLVATGSPVAQYKWFDSQTSTTPLASTTPVASGTYYVTQTISTCESPKATVVVTLNNVTAPVVADQVFCTGATVANLQATAATGATIKWYATETSATALTATTVLASNTYYVTQKINNCESGRIPVVVTVNGVVDAPVASAAVVCQGSSFEDISVELAEGATANWYATNAAVETLDAEAAVTAGTYYVSQTIGICESTRTEVVVSFNVIALPTTESFVVCSGTSFSELEVEGVEGATFNWYATLDTTTPTDGAELASAGTFYVSQTVEGCEGGRVPVAISLTSTGSPAPAENQVLCGEGLVSDLNGGGTTGYQVNWYSPEGDLLTADDVLVTGTYTVSQTFNGCESPAIEVSVVVTAIPDAPEGPETQEFNAGDTLSDLDIEFTEGTTTEWFVLDEDVWISIPAGTPLVNGNVYGVSQSAGTCDSEMYTFTASVVLGTANFELTNVVVYPNPASDVLNIDGKDTLSEIVVINLLGQQVLRQQANDSSAKINISALPQATYILQVYAANGTTASFKIVKQ